MPRMLKSARHQGRMRILQASHQVHFDTRIRLPIKFIVGAPTHQQEQFDSGYMDAAAHGRESE